MIPYGRQDITETDIEAVVDVLRSDYLTQGPKVPLFEKSVSSFCGAKYAVAVNSATAALHIACLALGLGEGDWLWTSSITFVASSNCALYCGAQVDFIDIDPKTYNMSVDALEEKLIKAEKDGKLPKIVVPVHLCGQSCDMEKIKALSEIYGFKIIEDASHAIGGKYLNNYIGDCKFSDITIFSFHPVKIITTAEGGMALTNNPKLAKYMQMYRSHGITSDSNEMFDRPSNEIWNYQQILLGFNYRMTEIQAALGISQLERINDFVSKRHEIVNRYNTELLSLNLEIPWQLPGTYSSYHLYPICINTTEAGRTQKDIYKSFHEMGVNVNLHYIPVYLQPFYQGLGFRVGYCPEAEKYFKKALSIPVFPTMTDDQQDRVIKSIKRLLP